METNKLVAAIPRLESTETGPNPSVRASCVLVEPEPVPTALYRHFDAEDKLLYVGISLSPTYRLSQHADGSSWFQRIAKVTVEWFPARAAALHAERRAIQSESPEFNIVHARPSSARAAYLQELAEESCAELTRKVTRFRSAYTACEAADVLGVPEMGVRLAIASGDLTCFPTGPKSLCISGWSLIAYLEALEAGSVKIPRTPKTDDGRSVPMPTLDWLCENHGGTTIAAWVDFTMARWSAQASMAA